MSLSKKICIWITVLATSFMLMAPSQAAMVETSDIISQSERNQLLSTLEQKNIQQQLVDLGVDPEASIARINQMTNEELKQLNGQLNELPVGAGISTTDLLLIIILVILLA